MSQIYSVSSFVCVAYVCLSLAGIVLYCLIIISDPFKVLCFDPRLYSFHFFKTVFKSISC